LSWGGEDALCVNSRSFGIFDGVSGAEKLDGVPLYSKTLAQQLKSSMGPEPLTVKDLKVKLLLAAEYADIAATGASTATIASIGEDNVLRAVCLGDSPLLVIRNGIIHSRTKDTLHYFDCPYQLSENSPDRPRDASVKEIKLVPGDVIIAGSDGIFDNLEDQAIIDIVNSQTGNKRASRIVEKIVSESRRVSLDPKAPTPYAVLAKRNRYDNYKSGLGGKLDDISCIVVECKER
jgi:protein phosphatase PTC7